ncbi:hypothetical protein [Neptunomonas japonica]|uniref:hypothetical protein n=1 Tax=Neptunomonas japonica TaxID=417574 RepID=UPI00048FA5C5|nr:hypothetical protein [Neptunomonas japonica]
MRNPRFPIFRKFCADACKKPLVTQDEYLKAIDMYLDISRAGNGSSRRANLRWVQLVAHKYLRTSVLSESHNYPRSVFMALKSHNRTVSRHTASPQDTKSGGGRSSSHRLGRYNNPFQGEFFKRLTSVKTVRALVSSYLTGSPLNTDEVVHNVRP